MRSQGRSLMLCQDRVWKDLRAGGVDSPPFCVSGRRSALTEMNSEHCGLWKNVRLFLCD